MDDLFYRKGRNEVAKVRKEKPFALLFASLAPSRIKFGTGFAVQLRQ
jgi:hypothetical protein